MIRNKQLLKKKEQGYALIIVLFVITVFSVLGLTVISVSFNNTKQFSKETTQTQALNIAEMGLKAYDKKIKSNINGLTAFDASQFQSKLTNALLVSFNSSSDYSINSMQGSPSYTVTRGEVGDPLDNKITVTITSQGTSGGDTQTITQTKTFKYQTVSSEDAGDFNHLKPFMGVYPIYVSGGYHNGYLSWLSSDYTPKWISEGDFVHQGDAYINQNKVIISGRQPTTNDVIHQTVDLSQVKSQFLQMPLQTPQNHSIDGAISNNEYAVLQSVYNGNINFNSFNLKSSNPNVTINGKAYLGSSTSSSDLASGTVTFNDDVAINGDLNAGNNIHFVFKGNVYINGSINASDHASMDFEKSLYIAGGNINLNGNSELDIGGNCFVASGSLNGSANSTATFRGNTFFNHDYNSSGNHHFIGYVFINGSFNNSGPLTFDKTVYVQGDFYPKADNYSVVFSQGLITAGGNASPSTNGNGVIIINSQVHGGDSSGGSSSNSGQSPITIVDTKTNYQ